MRPSGRSFVAVILLLMLSLAGPLRAEEDASPGLVVTLETGESVLSLDGGAPFHRTGSSVQDERLIRLPGTGTRIALWSEVQDGGPATPYYSVGPAGGTMAEGTRTSYVLKMLHGDFDPAGGAPEVEASLSSGAAARLYIVQFVTQPLNEFRDTIEGLGGKTLGFLPRHAHVVRMSPEVRSQVETLPFVRWIGPYHPAYRIETFLRVNETSVAELFPLQRYNILVFESGAAGKPVVAKRIESLGGTVDSPDAGKFRLIATLTPQQLFEVIRWDEVQFVDRWSPLEKDMDIVRSTGGADYVESVAGYTGQGVRAEAFDTGFNVNHPDFQSNPLLIHGGPVALDSHGTAVAGVCFGDGTGDPQARGLMPDAQGIVADYNNVGLSGVNRYNHTGELLQSPYFAVFQTSSVGDSRTTAYTTISADHDTMLFDWDILHCQSQSNAGDQMSRPQAWAKNVLSGGAFNHYNTATLADDCWCSTGSIGPASDGRIKPDLSFFYDLTYTTYTTGTGYGEFGGTSGATPSICGYSGLFFQMWSDGLFGNEVDPGGTVFDNRPHMTTAKAFMINTAKQYAFSGQTHDLTRTHQGWGVPSVENLYDLRDNISFIDESVLLGNLESVEFNALVDPGEPALKVTLTYADPAGNPAASEHRINDLTLKVTSPSAVVYWGNNGLLDGNWSQSGGTANTVDTVENVFVQNPEAGSWIVEVIASEINQDGHVETPALDADFALVTSGAFMATCTADGRLSLDRSSYMCEDQATIRVVDCDLDADGSAIETVIVTIDSGSEPGGESVLLTETGPATATFTATISLSETDAGGVLLVAGGDTATATYVDADDGMGGFGVSKIDTAGIDCTPPVISNVQTTNVQARSATVTFDTDELAEGTVRYGSSCVSLTLSQFKAGHTTSHSIDLTGLTEDSMYFYAVDAVDEAGNSGTNDNSGACYSFATPQIPDYFTEQFDVGNDLDFLRLTFTPDGSSDFYDSCTNVIAAFPTDPSGGTALSLTDDSFATVTLTGGATVPLYGTSYGTFYVGSNGYVTFTSGQSDYTETLGEHFNQPRISALYDDLNPASAGTVSWEQLADRVVVTWQAVPEYSQSTTNDVQIEMFFSGAIAINYLGVSADDGIVGLSNGGGLPADFFETDLSAMASCGAETCFDAIQNQGEARIDCGGPCPACQCLSDPECVDSLFCDGVETCNAFGLCQPGADPCPGQACKESNDQCVDCLSDPDCDDGSFCNGVETCVAGNTCLAGLDPCPFQACDDVADVCLACDNDGTCEPGEDCGNCPGDCISGSNPVCGNDICEAADGEDCLTCAADCNGVQTGQPADRYCCGDGVTGENPVTCADARCDAGGNTCSSTLVLTFCCGDGTCEDIETLGNCAADCTPAVPGEAGNGQQMQVTGYDAATGMLSMSFGVPCAAADHTIEYGELTRANLEGYSWAGQECGLGMTGTYDWSTSGAPQNLFFIVVSNNGAEEGSYGKDHRGAERPADAAAATCPMVQNLQYACE